MIHFMHSSRYCFITLERDFNRVTGKWENVVTCQDANTGITERWHFTTENAAIAKYNAECARDVAYGKTRVG